jgi:hypothetical protein
MYIVRDQQGRFISSSKKPRKTNSAGQSQEGKEHSQPNYLSPTTSSISKRRPETSSLKKSETVQGSMHTKVPLSEGLIGEQYHSKEFIFPKVPLETKDIPQREMAQKLSRKKPLLLDS